MSPAGSLLDALAAQQGGSLVFHGDDTDAQRFTAGQLLDDAEHDAPTLAAAGVEPGDTVGLIGPNEHAWVRWAFAVWRAGATLVPLQFPFRVGDRSALAERVRAMTGAAGCRLVVGDPALLDVIPGGLALDWTKAAGPGGAAGPAADSPAPAVAQFTSGTTGAPKAALVGHHAVVQAVRATGTAYEITADDVFAGWQPFFHDLGLFGLLLRPLLLGLDAHFVPTARFARDPAEWFRLIGRSRATVTAGPCSAWGVAIRASRRDTSGCDLSSVRVAGFSADTIEPAIVDSLLRTGFGLDEDSAAAAYGLAESTLALTVTAPGRGLRFDEVDSGELAATGRARPPGPGSAGRRIASCGMTVPGAEIEVVGPDGNAVPDRMVGRIRGRAPYASDGYLGEPPRGRDAWLETGDLGYVSDGELFFTGRERDEIVVLGRNHPPEELEWAAARVDGVRAGRTVAFATPGRPEGAATVAVEVRAGANPAALALMVRRAVTDAVGVTPAEVLVLLPGTVPKTTSGKVRRGALRDRHAAGGLNPLARWPARR